MVLVDTLWRNAALATMAGGSIGRVEDGVLACRDGRIVYAGPAAGATGLQAATIVDCGGRLITPGLVDCHTHLVHAGDRAEEFERRLAGESYANIAQAGGGILSTVRATQDASEDELLAQSLPRLAALRAEGVTTVEIKSGYGLTADAEARQLRVARRLEPLAGVRVVTSFLAAHVLPPEFAGRADAFIDHVIGHSLAAIVAEGLADAVDVYCEGIAFTPQQCARLLDAARAAGLAVKIHAEQLSNSGGAILAAERGALSADHLEYLDNAGVRAMATAGTVAVLLPGAFHTLRETRQPPVDALRAAGVPIAVATDCNPGTSPLTSPLLAMNLAATLFRLTVEECLAGFTREAARALGLADEIGTLEAGKWCDAAIWSVGRPAELVYRMGFNPLHARIWRGR